MSSQLGRKTLAGVATAAAVAAATAVAVISHGTGVIGPGNMVQPTGRQLHPAGKLVEVGNFPTGGGLSPNGRFLWTLSAGRGINDIRIVQVGASRGHGTGRVVQTLPMPGLDGGMAFSPDGRTAYVSGIPESKLTDLKVPSSIPGHGGDVISVFKVDPSSGRATRDGVIAVPPPASTPVEQAFPPPLLGGTPAKASWPIDLAVSPNGKTLLAALNLANMAAVINTATRSVRYVPVGRYPFGAAITANGRYGLVSSETQATVSVIKLASASVVKTITVGPHLADSEGMAVDPKAPLAFVANANEDVISVINTDRLRVQGLLSVARPQGNGTTPNALDVTSDGCDLLSADAGEDAVAVFALSTAASCNPGGHGRRNVKRFALVGRIPVASYPTLAAADSTRGVLAWIAADGIGVGPNPNGPRPTSPYDTDGQILHFQYIATTVRGDAGVLPFPSDAQIHALTPVADRELVPTDAQAAPAGTPIRAHGPIKHVFLIIKENRTYDQVLGDIKKGDGDPALTLFGANITPNMHALAERFPLLDHVYADSQVSVQGHYWTSSGEVPAYVIKNWPPSVDYGQRGRPYDFGFYEVAAPPEGYLFDRAIADGVSFYNYGEAYAGITSAFADADRTPAEKTEEQRKLDGSDVALLGGGPAYPGGPSLSPCYDSDVTIFNPLGSTADVFDSSLPAAAPAGSVSRYACWLTRFEQQVGHNAVPALNYIALPLDHTEGVAPGDRTPYADVADNDWALGEMVDTISHSSIWNSSMILVIEDDAQDGADHVDAHRIPALVISPYARQGAVIPNRYDQLSFLRTMEIVVGMKPAYLAEALAVPLYDAFSSQPSNGAPYDAIAPKVSVTATNPNTAMNRDAVQGLDFNLADQVPEQQFDAMLWHFVHGWKSKPPAPGPNAAPNATSGADADAIVQPSSFSQLLSRWLKKGR